jgi:N-acetylglucosaminyldiphosphoundecaprenol N-acetyl-beta-D-mannosaminyltransferase
MTSVQTTTVAPPLPDVLPLPAHAQRVGLGHLGIDTYSHETLVADVLQHALTGTNTRQIVTANAQFYVLAEQNSRFRQCLEAADYICADGMPIVWACNRYCHATVPRIAGVDLIEDVCQSGAANGLRIFLLGGRPQTAAKTAEILQLRYKGLEVAGVSCPPFGFEKDESALASVLDHIARAQPHVLFVGLGAPKQELFINEHIRRLKVPVAIGIGGSFEILSGSISRAPQWMQTSGLEWAYRLGQEPRRLWKRYLIGNLQFVTSLLKWRFQSLRERTGLEAKLRRS